MNGIENIVDDAAHIAVLDSKGHVQKRGSSTPGIVTGIKDDTNVDWKALWSEGTDAVMDVPIGGVCEVLYG